MGQRVKSVHDDNLVVPGAWPRLQAGASVGPMDYMRQLLSCPAARVPRGVQPVNPFRPLVDAPYTWQRLSTGGARAGVSMGDLPR